MKLFCSYLYTKRVTVSTNSDQSTLLEYEHIIPVKRLVEAIGNGEGWPINNIANLMLLPKNLNGMKQHKTLKEHFQKNPNPKQQDETENYLITEIDGIINIDGQPKGVFTEYCDKRWKVILEALLVEAFDYLDTDIESMNNQQDIVEMDEKVFTGQEIIPSKEKYLSPQMIVLEKQSIQDFEIHLSKTLLGKDLNKSYCCTLPKPIYGAVCNEFNLSAENLQENAKFVINGKFCSAQLRFINQNRTNVRTRRADELPFRQLIQLEFKDIKARETLDLLFSEQAKDLLTKDYTSSYLEVKYVGNRTFTCKIKG